MTSTIAFGPASIANVGPFFDVMGYCLGHLGDFVEAKKTPERRGTLLHDIKGPYADELRQHLTNPNARNCVEVIADAIWSEYQEQLNYGIDLTLYKYMPIKSGLGSSAASCVATTKALLEILGSDVQLDDTQKNNIMMHGEREVSGHYYPDNVVPSFWGGFHIISQQWQQRIQVPEFYTVVFLSGHTDKTGARPHFVRDMADTGEKRNELAKFFDPFVKSGLSNGHKIEKLLNYLRFQSRSAARLMHALHTDNITLVGEIISAEEDNFLFDARDSYTRRKDIWEIARNTGALGCAVAGSGPAIFVLTPTESAALKVRDAVLSREQFNNALWLISKINDNGSSIVTSVDEFVEANSRYHNFWKKDK